MVGVLDGLGQQFALYISAIDKIIFKIPVGSGQGGLSDISADPEELIFSLQRNQLPGNIPAVNLIDRFFDIAVSAGIQTVLSVLDKFKGNLRMGQGQLFYYRCHRVSLRSGGF